MLDKQKLKSAADQLSAEVRAIHAAGSGELQLSRFSELLGSALPQEAADLIASRGALKFQARGPDGGTFENLGDEASVKTELATVKIPPAIHGGYAVSGDTLDIRFSSGHTVVAKKAFISAPLESISVDPREVRITVGGALGPMLSKTIELE